MPVTAGMTLAMMTVAAMTLAVRMVVMIAAGVGIVGQFAAEKRLHRRVGLAFHTPVEANARLRQRLLRTPADAAAYQRIHAMRFEHLRQRAVTFAPGVHHGLGGYLSVLHIVQLELFGMSEMLKNLSVVIGLSLIHI